MADSEILRKFLVSLGFDVNDIEQRKFDKSLERAEAGAIKLGKTLLGTAGAAQALVMGYTEAMSKLYYQSQQTGASVANLFTGGESGRTIGLTADSIKNAVASLARTLREQPGVQGLIENLGVKVTGRDMSDVLTDIVTKLKDRPFYEAAQYWKTFGQDPDTLLAMEQNLEKFVKMQAEYQNVLKQSGLDAQSSAKDFADYETGLLRLENRFKVLGAVIAHDFLPYFKEFTDDMTKGLDEFFKNKNDAKQPLVPKIVHNDNPQTRTRTALDDFFPADWVSWLYTGKTGVPAYDLGESEGYAGGGRGFDRSNRVTPKGGAAGKTGTRGQRNNNPGNIEYGSWARSMGATGSDGRFAIFPDMATGSRAMAALLSNYGKRGINTPAGIVNTWSNAKESDDRNAAYIAEVMKATGAGANSALDMSDPKTLATLLTAMGKHESGVDPMAGAAPVIFNQHTEINVHGVSNPQTAGKVVLDNQDRVNGDALRNLKGKAF